MKRVIPLLCLFTAGWLSMLAQPCGLEDTLNIAANTNLAFDFEIFNIFNDDLSDPDQGVCAVEIEFLHQYVDNLELSLTSPSGQTVTLIGPDTDEQFAFTAFARWDIRFLPCGDPVDPDPGFLPQWNNAQPNNFVLGGQYDGSYYPFMGCLEAFNTGSVNGNWTINVSNNPSPYLGAILGFRIVFCDERGLDCCFAASGDLLQDDILTCVGDSSLLFTPQVSYDGIPPDTVNYGYTYLIGEDSTLLAYDSLPDLTSFPPGRYQLCGLSYRRSDRDSFPVPDGNLSIDSLRRNLGGLLPDFCAEVTDSCIWVEIVPQPTPVNLQETICAGDTLMVGDSTLTTTGDYAIVVSSYAGCDSLVNVDLTVVPTAFTDIDTTICIGDSFQVGDSLYQSTGSYVDTLLSSQLCDSIVSLNLEVLDTVFTDTTLTICQGDQFVVGDSVLTDAGDYEISLLSSQACDSVVRVSLTVLELSAVIAGPDSLSCAQTEVILDGSASMPSAVLSYEWRQEGGAVLGNLPTQSVDQPGLYYLSVSRTEGGIGCTVTDTVVVPIDTMPPIADAGPADTLTCALPEVSVGGIGSSTGDAFSYAWTSTDGHFTGNTDLPITTVDSSGLYTLIVTDSKNGCTDTASVQIFSDQISPVADPGPDTTLTCNRTSLRLDGSASSVGNNFVYNWTNENGTVPVDGTTITPLITDATTYLLQVINSDNGCMDSGIVVVSYDTLSPAASVLPPETLNCEIPETSLQASVTDAGQMPVYEWQTATGNIISGGTSATALVDAPAVYLFIAERTENGCRDSVEITVEETISDIDAIVALPDTLNCAASEVTLDGTASSTGPDVMYQWLTQQGVFTGDSTNAAVSVSAPAAYTLIVTDTFTRCADTLIVEVAEDTLSPLADAGPDRQLTCDSTFVTLDGSGSSLDGPYSYDWLEVTTTTLVAIDSLYPQIGQPGSYLLIVTDNSNGCFDTSTVEVTLAIDPPLVDIAIPDTLNCERTSLTLDASGSDNGPAYSPSWIAAGGGVLESGNNSLTPVVSAAGQYTLTIENDSTGCTNSAAVAVVDTLSAVSAQLTASDTLSCDITAVVLTANTEGNTADVVYQWSTLEMGSDITINQPGEYQLVAVDTFTRCSDTLNYTMPADTLPPDAEAGSGFELTCSVLQGTLDGSASSSSNTSFSWSGPCITSNADSVAVTADCPGTYTITVQNDSNGCTASDTVTVTQEDEIPLAVIDGEYTLNCDSLTRTLDATASSQGDHLVYSWTGPGILNGGNGLQPTVDLGGMYTLLVQDTLNECESSASVNVAWDTLSPVANAGIAEVLNCDSTTIEIGGVESSMGPEFTYEWSGPADGFVSSNTGPFAEVSLPGTYSLVVTDSTNGCSASATTTVFLDDDPPQVDAGPDQELNCATPIVILDGTISTDDFNIMYEWQGPCLLSAADSNQVSVDCEGLYILIATNTATGCVGTDTVEVTRDSLLPAARLSDSLQLSCEDGTAILDGLASDGEQFLWFFNGEPVNFTGLSPTVDSVGVYTLVALNSAGGCSDTAQVMVTLDCRVEAAIATPDTLTCAHSTVTLDASATVAEGATNYFWQVPAGNCIVEGQNSPQLIVRCPGFYTLVVSNQVSGQADSLTVEVILNDDPPVAEAGDNVLLTCDTPTNSLSATGSTTGDQIGYSWEKLEDEFFRKDSFNITVDDDGTYFLIVTDSTTGCTAQDVVSVQRSDEQHDINFGSLVVPCLQDSFWLMAFIEPPGPDYDYSWEGDIILDAADSSTVLVDTAGTLRLTVVNTENNCVSIREIELRQQDCIPCIEISSADSLTCVADSVQLSASFCEPCTGCTLQWSGPAGGLLSPSDTLSVWVGSPGEYTLVATDTLGFTTVERITVVQDTLLPEVNLESNRELDCATPQLTLGMAGVPTEGLAYQWSNASTGILPMDTLPVLMVSEAGVFTLQVTDLSSGCTNAATTTVSIDSLRPQADAGPTRQLDCTANTVSLDGSGSDFGTNLIYNWTGPSTATIAGAGTVNPAVNQEGWYFLSVRDSTNGCVATDSVLVTASNDLPPVPELTDTVITCRNPVVNLFGELPPGGNYSSCWYRLNAMGNPTGPCVTDLVIPVSITGDFRFEITNTDNGCTNSVDVTITEDTDTPDVSLPDTLLLNCPPDTLTIPAAVLPAGPAYSYDWSGPDGAIVSGATAVDVQVVAPGFYTVVAENEANGCSASASTIVLPNENIPTLELSPDTSLNCLRTSLRLSVAVATESGSADILWQTGDGQIVSGANTATPLVNAPGWYVATATDPVSGCQVQDSVQVVDAAFLPEAGIDSVALELNCRNDSLLLDATASLSGSGEALSYEWRRGAFEVIGSAPQQWIRTAGNYRLLVRDEGSGCLDTLLFTVQSDFEEPVVQLDIPALLTCFDSTILLTPEQPSSAEGFSFEWLGADGVLIPGADTALAVSAPGTYTLIVTDEDNGCTASDSVVVESDLLAPDVSITPPQDINCDRPTVILDASDSSTGTALDYEWSSGDGQLQGVTDEILATASAPGWYTLSITDTDNGCAAQDSVEVIQTAEVITEALWSVSPPSCPGDSDGSIALDSIVGGTMPFFLAIEGGALTEGTSFEGLDPGMYQLQIEDVNGCTWEESVEVPEAEGASVSLGDDRTIRLGEQDTLLADVGLAAYDSIWWWPTDGVVQGESYIVAPTQTTLYQVWVQNSSGCVATDQLRIQVIDDLPVFLPNVFSPNGDEQNDLFMVFADDSIDAISSFKVFDRWGNMVHEAQGFPPNDPAYGWDGNMNGYEMDSAVFTYLVELVLADGKRKYVAGEVLLLR